jgi:hypothetical protein
MAKGAIIIGIGLVLIGIWGVVKIFSLETPFWVLLYPLFSIGIGIALIVLNKEEGKIEQRKDLKSKKSKR